MNKGPRASSKAERAKGIVGAVAFAVLLSVLFLGSVFLFIYGGAFIVFLLADWLS